MVPQQDVLHPSSLWSSVAAAESDWSQALLNLDHAWAMWCFDIENYLVQAGLLDSHQPERKVGDVPTVRTGSHRVGATQSITERHVRRFIRRLHEARTLAWRGMRTPHTLYNKLLGTNCPASEQEAVRAHAWGLAHQMATVRLRQLQDAHRNDALQKWRARMRDLPQACQWLRKEEAAPLAFKDVDHSILTSPLKLSKNLKLFGQTFLVFRNSLQMLTLSFRLIRMTSLIHYPHLIFRPSQERTRSGQLAKCTEKQLAWMEFALPG